MTGIYRFMDVISFPGEEVTMNVLLAIIITLVIALLITAAIVLAIVLIVRHVNKKNKADSIPQPQYIVQQPNEQPSAVQPPEQESKE